MLRMGYGNLPDGVGRRVDHDPAVLRVANEIGKQIKCRGLTRRCPPHGAGKAGGLGILTITYDAPVLELVTGVSRNLPAFDPTWQILAPDGRENRDQ